MKYLNIVIEIIASSIIATIICTGTAYLQALVIFKSLVGGIGGIFTDSLPIGEVSSIVVTPVSIFLGPILYFSLLRKLLTLNRLVLLTIVHFIIGGLVIVLIHVLSGIGFYFMHLTPIVTIIVCILFRLFMEEYIGEDQS